MWQFQQATCRACFFPRVWIGIELTSRYTSFTQMRSFHPSASLSLSLESGLSNPQKLISCFRNYPSHDLNRPPGENAESYQNPNPNLRSDLRFPPCLITLNSGFCISEFFLGYKVARKVADCLLVSNRLPVVLYCYLLSDLHLPGSWHPPTIWQS